MLGTPSSPTRGELENCKKLQKGVPGTFWFNKGGAKGFWGTEGVGTIFDMCCTSSACDAFDIN